MLSYIDNICFVSLSLSPLRYLCALVHSFSNHRHHRRWGQMSHLLAFVYRVTQLEPRSVTCTMVGSPVTGADLHNSAVITCTNGATISLSGTAAVRILYKK